MAFDAGEIKVGTPVRVRLTDVVLPAGEEQPEGVEVDEQGKTATWIAETTLGRALFNETLPEDYPFVNEPVDRKRLSTIVNDLAERYTKVEVAASLDALKEAGYHWASRSGTTVALSDVVTPPRKPEILAAYEEKATKVQMQYERGLITYMRTDSVHLSKQAIGALRQCVRDKYGEGTALTDYHDLLNDPELFAVSVCTPKVGNNPLFHAMVEAGEQAGYARTDDLNGYRQEGFGPMDRTVTPKGRRASTARGYLDQARQRPNLTIRTHALTERILFDGRRASQHQTQIHQSRDIQRRTHGSRSFLLQPAQTSSYSDPRLPSPQNTAFPRAGQPAGLSCG